jgi:hypothetical protein
MVKVVDLPASISFTVIQALDSAKQLAENENLQDVLIIGYNGEGKLAIRSSKMDRKSALWLLETAKGHVLDLDQ